MTQQEIKNNIINDIISPLMVAALKQNASEIKAKNKEIYVDEIESPLQEIVDTFDNNKIKEVMACLEWYEGHMKGLLNYIKKPLEAHIGSLSDSEYTQEIDSELIDATFTIKTTTSYSSNTDVMSPLKIKEKFNISDEVMPTRINAPKLAEAIKNNDKSVIDAINSGYIIIKTTEKRSLSAVKLREDEENNDDK